MIHGYLTASVTKKRQYTITSKKTGRAITKTRIINKQLALYKHNLLTNAGRDAFHALCYTNTAAGTRGFGFIAATESTITPAATDTTLTGEITDRGIGPRSSADAVTKTHSAGTNSTLIEHTFTVSGAGFTSVLASATFVASSAGTMGHIANFTTGSGLLASGDTLKISWTLNLG